MSHEKKPPILQNGEEREAIIREWQEDLFYMRLALRVFLKEKYPGHDAMIDDICELVHRAIGARKPQGGGGAGMVRGWLERLEEISSGLTREREPEEVD